MTIIAAAVRILCRLPPNRTTIIAPTTNASQPPREPVAISGIMATLSPAAARNLSDRRTFARSTDRASVIIIARYGAASLGEARLPQIRDGAHAEDEHSGAGQGESGGHHEGQVELAGAVHHEPGQRRGQHSGEVAEAVLKAGPLAGGPRSGQDRKSTRLNSS